MAPTKETKGVKAKAKAAAKVDAKTKKAAAKVTKGKSPSGKGSARNYRPRVLFRTHCECECVRDKRSVCHLDLDTLKTDRASFLKIKATASISDFTVCVSL